MTSQTPASGLIRDENMNAYMPGFGNDFETEALPDARSEERRVGKEC